MHTYFGCIDDINISGMRKDSTNRLVSILSFAYLLKTIYYSTNDDDCLVSVVDHGDYVSVEVIRTYISVFKLHKKHTGNVDDYTGSFSEAIKSSDSIAIDLVDDGWKTRMTFRVNK